MARAHRAGHRHHQAGAHVARSRRGRVERWLPPPTNITVPPTAPFGGREHCQAVETLAFGLARLLASVGLAGLIRFILALVVRPAPSVLDLTGKMLLWSWQALRLIIPFGTSMALATTNRILLLRPFDQRAMTQTLKRIVLRYFGRAGHVFTLSDINYRPNPLMRLGDLIATDHGDLNRDGVAMVTIIPSASADSLPLGNYTAVIVFDPHNGSTDNEQVRSPRVSLQICCDGSISRP